MCVRNRSEQPKCSVRPTTLAYLIVIGHKILSVLSCKYYTENWDFDVEDEIVFMNSSVHEEHNIHTSHTKTKSIWNNIV